MVAQNLLDNVFSLSLDERMELLVRLRENVRNDPAASELTDEDKQVLDERLADYEADPAEGSSWDEVEARILDSLRVKS